MAELKLEHIYKVYPNGVKAVSDFTMDIKDQEFIVFVGPSGCGKSTTLRMIAGLEDISAGELYIGDKIVNDVEPKDRDIAMVFQNYALYPHMTVYENMAFGLQLRHVPAEEIHEKILWAANILGLTEYLDRKPKAMSGGQRQRVALGRAILRNPKVMLLDEPLSNLDAKLRAQMRSEIAKLHQDLKTTFIYVTHDQVEAMTLGTRVVVMKLGVIQQIDTPKNLYDFPQNKFVAGFIGTPQMNFFEGYLNKNGEKVEINIDYTDNKLSVDVNDLIKVQPYYFDGKHKVWIGIRCENLSVDPEIVKTSKSKMKMKISHFEELGNETLIYGDLNMDGDGFKESSTTIIVKGKNTYGYHIGDVIDCHIDVKKTHFFDYNDEKSIVPRIPALNVLSAEIKGDEILFDGMSISIPKAIEHKNSTGDLFVPIEAIEIGEGNLKGKIVDIENIDGKKLAYIKLNERVIFSLIDESVKVGDEINFDIDITKISLKNGEEDLIKTLNSYNSITSTFINYATANNDTKNKNLDILNKRIEKVNNDFNEKQSELNKKYEELIAEASKKDFVSIKEKNDKYLAEETKKVNETLSSLKDNFKKGVKEENDNFKKAKKETKEKVLAEYKRRKQEENESYKKLLSTNKDKDVYRKRKQEHQDFKENFSKERENDLNRALDGVSLVHESNINGIKAPFKRKTKILKNNLKSLKAKLERENNELKALKDEEKKELNNLNKERNLEIQKAKQIFFFKIADQLYLSPDVITNKMIQGLGTKVFIKDFRIDIPSNKIILSETNNGIEGKVVGHLDYGKKQYNIVSIKCNGEELLFNCETSKVYDNDKTVYISFNLEDVKITETSMNIRIY